MAAKAGFSPTAGTIYRALHGIREGSSTGPAEKGLLDLGYVVKHDADDIKLATYEITDAGLDAVTKYLDEYDLPDLRRRKGSVNLRYLRPADAPSVSVFPDEVEPRHTYREGAVQQVVVNAYERSDTAKRDCVRHYGATCFICGFDFGRTYGPVVEGLIHVHHLKPLSEIGAEYVVDPIADLRPVCPNCHAVLHSRKPAYSVEDVLDFLL